MKKPDMEDYLQEGIYGSRETKPGERKKFLGTLRERALIALTKGQVMQELGKEELSDNMKQHPEAKLLLNGNVSYRFLSPYKDIADKQGVHHTTISNQQSETDLGAVLTLDYAIEKETITIEVEEKKKKDSTEEDGMRGFFKSLFKPPE
jgi:uncharacterized protein YueI